MKDKMGDQFVLSVAIFQANDKDGDASCESYAFTSRLPVDMDDDEGVVALLVKECDAVHEADFYVRIECVNNDLDGSAVQALKLPHLAN